MLCLHRRHRANQHKKRRAGGARRSAAKLRARHGKRCCFSYCNRSLISDSDTRTPKEWCARVDTRIINWTSRKCARYRKAKKKRNEPYRKRTTFRCNLPCHIVFPSFFVCSGRYFCWRRGYCQWPAVTRCVVCRSTCVPQRVALSCPYIHTKCAHHMSLDNNAAASCIRICQKRIKNNGRMHSDCVCVSQTREPAAPAAAVFAIHQVHPSNRMVLSFVRFLVKCQKVTQFISQRKNTYVCIIHSHAC